MHEGTVEKDSWLISHIYFGLVASLFGQESVWYANFQKAPGHVFPCQAGKGFKTLSTKITFVCKAESWNWIMLEKVPESHTWVKLKIS